MNTPASAYKWLSINQFYAAHVTAYPVSTVTTSAIAIVHLSEIYYWMQLQQFVTFLCTSVYVCELWVLYVVWMHINCGNIMDVNNVENKKIEKVKEIEKVKGEKGGFVRGTREGRWVW